MYSYILHLSYYFLSYIPLYYIYLLPLLDYIWFWFLKYKSQCNNSSQIIPKLKVHDFYVGRLPLKI
jgi:hypothetical protein